MKLIQVLLIISLASTATIGAEIGDSLISGFFDSGVEEGWVIETQDKNLIDTTDLYSVYHRYSTQKSLHIKIKQDQDESWHTQLQLPYFVAEKGALYKFSMQAFGVGKIQVGVVLNDEDYTYKEGFSFTLENRLEGEHPGWNSCHGEFSSDTAGDGALLINIDFGKNAGDYYFDDIVVEKVGEHDTTNSWYRDADNRIDAIRKGDFQLTLQDSLGNSINSGECGVQLIKHDFDFGTALSLGNESLTQTESGWYKAKAAELFNTISIESDFKWPEYETVRGVVDSLWIDEYCDYAKRNDMKVRGHTLFWGIEKFNYDQHWSRQISDLDFIAAIKERVERDVSYFEEKIDEYDVWNEPFNERAIFNQLENQLGSENIWSIMDSAFIWSREIDPKAGLFINEYSIVAGGQTQSIIDIVEDMQSRNIPITGVGAQAHFGNNPIEPEIIRYRLDKLAELGVDLKITEFDLGNPDEGVTKTEEEIASDYAKFFRTIFSHPATSGLTIWGFWDKIIWNRDPNGVNQSSGLFDDDRNIKMSGDSIVKLLKNDWNTAIGGLPVSEMGTYFRGFYGKYRVFATVDGKRLSGDVNFTPNSLTQTATLFTNTTPIAKENIKKSNEISVATDVSNKRIFLSGLSQSNRQVVVKLIDLRGRTIFSKQYTNSSSITVQLPSTTSTGVHILQVKGKNLNIRKKLFIAR
jgi:endo-1,4-beta-xylanase